MAQQVKKKSTGKKAPQYSSNTVALRYAGGLFLVAVGALMFMAVAMNTEGSVFDAVRSFTYGLGGGLAVMLPVIPVWGGVIMMLSAQRKAPMKAFLMVSALYLLVLTAVMLISQTLGSTGTMPLMDYFLENNRQRYTNPADYDVFLARGYELGRDRQSAGGLLGMLLAWPFWRLMGAVPGFIVVVMLALGDVFLIFRKEIMQIVAYVRNRNQERRQRSEQEQAALRANEMQWRIQQQNAQMAQMNMQQMQQPAPQQMQQPAQQSGAYMQPAWAQQSRNVKVGFRPNGQERYEQMSPDMLYRQQAEYTSALEEQKKAHTGKIRMPQLFGRKQKLEQEQLVQEQHRERQPAAQQRSDAYRRPTAPQHDTKNERTQPRPPADWQGGSAQPAAQQYAPVQEKPAQPERPATDWQSAQPAAQYNAPVQEKPAQPERSATDWQSAQPAAQQYAPVQEKPAQPERPATDWQSAQPAAQYNAPVQEKPAQPERTATDWQSAQPAAQQYAPVQEKPAQPERPVTDWQSAQPAAQYNAPVQEKPAQPERSAMDWQSAQHAANMQSAEAPRHAAKPETAEKPRNASPWQLELEKKRAEAAAAMTESEPENEIDDTPPWEEPVRKQPVVAAPVQVQAPKLQQEPPKAVWQPELHLPPRKEGSETEEKAAPEKRPYVKPPIGILKAPVPFQDSQDSAEDAERSRILEATVESFKMPATVEKITHGPRISRFEMRPEPGILVNRYQLLAGNIAMSMKAESVRIESPIPGTEYVGVEIPNKTAKLVTLREILESEEMRNHKSPLAVALGCDVAGHPVVCDIVKMPHLLIAGATGMGKSVCINTLINSVLYRTTPAEVRMILIDPKVVELQCYNGLPNLLLPVVNDPRKASAALEWAVAEMMERYNKMSERGVRKIEDYNNSLAEGEEKLHYILIVIDEMADLMMVCGKEVEASIQRLAQLARAAGIHLVLATQRPTVKVITGNIKTNIPGRIAFKTSSYGDSMVILDRKGAEDLLRNGDMIYNGGNTDTRTQGCFISTAEIEQTVKYICDHNTAEYDPDIMEQLENARDDKTPDLSGGTEPAKGGHLDPLLQQAIEWTVQEKQISVSNLQRKMSLGYARAARLVDMMEERGIVSPKDGAKPRMCLISWEEYQEMRRDLEESI